MRTLLAASAICFLCLALNGRVSAQAGALDPHFGQGGVVELPFLLSASPFDEARKVAIQPNGKILVVGRAGGDASGIWRSAFAVMRLNTDGSLDASFGPNHDGYFIFPWADVAADAHAIAFDTDGDIVIGGNVGNLGGMLWLTANGTLDPSKGDGGTKTFSVNGDVFNTTTLGDLVVEDGRPATANYGVAFAGNYNGSGRSQVALGWYSYDQSSSGSLIVEAFDAAGTSTGPGGSVATSILPSFYAPGLTVGGYVDLDDGTGTQHSNCFVADFGVIGHFQQGTRGTVLFDWEPGYDYFLRIGQGGDSVDCFVDTLASASLGDYVIAGGREIYNGAWIATYFELQHNDVTPYSLTPYYGIYQMTPWGENSIRAVLPEDGGLWAFVGFSGVDASAVSDPVVTQFDWLSQTLDPTFGNGGISLLDFDPQDYQSGQAFGAALDAQGCIVEVGDYYDGGSTEAGRDFSQIFIARVQGGAGVAADTIFGNGFDPPLAACDHR
ncbi:MAG: delta-60 repeat domain-containing protein [Dokdonella sp.]